MNKLQKGYLINMCILYFSGVFISWDFEDSFVRIIVRIIGLILLLFIEPIVRYEFMNNLDNEP